MHLMSLSSPLKPYSFQACDRVPLNKPVFHPPSPPWQCLTKYFIFTFFYLCHNMSSASSPDGPTSYFLSRTSIAIWQQSHLTTRWPPVSWSLSSHSPPLNRPWTGDTCTIKNYVKETVKRNRKLFWKVKEKEQRYIE